MRKKERPLPKTNARPCLSTLAAVMRSAAIYCLLACTLLICAGAQLPDAPEPKKDPGDLYNMEHYIHVVPRSPAEYHPATANNRFGWFVRSTVGPRSLAAGFVSAGYGTAVNNPHEYGTHWTGFAQRYGMRLTGISTGNAMEAGIGAIWGEDPRYFHTVHDAFGDRVKNVVDLTFRAYHPDGERYPAYARYMAIFGNNFLSNAWRVPSEADWQHAMTRSAEGFGGRFVSNAFSEFVPIIWRKVLGKPDRYPSSAHNP